MTSAPAVRSDPLCASLIRSAIVSFPGPLGDLPRIRRHAAAARHGAIPATGSSARRARIPGGGPSGDRVEAEVDAVDLVDVRVPAVSVEDGPGGHGTDRRVRGGVLGAEIGLGLHDPTRRERAAGAGYEHAAEQVPRDDRRRAVIERARQRDRRVPRVGARQPRAQSSAASVRYSAGRRSANIGGRPLLTRRNARSSPGDPLRVVPAQQRSRRIGDRAVAVNCSRAPRPPDSGDDERRSRTPASASGGTADRGQCRAVRVNGQTMISARRQGPAAATGNLAS